MHVSFNNCDGLAVRATDQGGSPIILEAMSLKIDSPTADQQRSAVELAIRRFNRCLLCLRETKSS
jgi:hypothetical protein